MSIAQIESPDLAIMARGQSTLYLLEAIGFSTDSRTLLVKATFGDSDDAPGALHYAVWTYDVASRNYKSCLNEILAGDENQPSDIDVLSATITGSGDNVSILTTSRTRGAATETKLKMISGTVVTTNIVEQLLGQGSWINIERYANSSDVRFVAIQTSSALLAPADSPDDNDTSDIYLVDLATQSIKRVSEFGDAGSTSGVTLGNVLINAGKVQVSFSTDGVFSRNQDLNSASMHPTDVYLWSASYDQSGLAGNSQVDLISRNATGLAVGWVDGESPVTATLSGIFFNTLSSLDSNGNQILNVSIGNTDAERRPVSLKGVNSLSYGASFLSSSADGRFIALLTTSPEVVGNSQCQQIILVDLIQQTWKVISSNGVELANDFVTSGVLSTDGGSLAFTSAATNLSSISSAVPGGNLFLVTTKVQVNEAPSVTSVAVASIAENVSTSIPAYTVTATDPDPNTTFKFSLSGGADANLFNLDSATGVLTFKISPNFEAPTDAGGDKIYNVIVCASDSSLFSERAVAITLIDVNETPSVTSGGLATTTENGSILTTVYKVTGSDPDANTTLTYSISGGADSTLFNINATTGAVTFNTSPNFEYPADVGANNIYDIVVQASDGSLSATQVVAITVTNINEAPAIKSGGTATTTENVATTTPVYTVTGTDPDANTTLIYSIAGGADASLFNINATTGVLTFKASPNFDAPADSGANNVYDIVVRASDGSLSATRAVAIAVININEAPTVTSGKTVTITENVSTSTAFYTATGTDTDANSTLSYSISGGVDAALFNINTTTGAVTFKTSPNFEAAADAGANNVYEIVVQASDGSLSATQPVAVTVTNLNEVPAVTSGGTATTMEGISTTTVVYTVIGTDPDANTTLTYSISGGADASLFNINGSTGSITFKESPNFEAAADADANNVYDMILQTWDGSLSATQVVAINVTNINEAPAITSGGTATTTENVATTTPVYTVTGTDPDANTTLIYSILGGADASLFNINATTGVLTFNASPNFDAPADSGANNVYNIVVQASDGSLSATQAVAITVARDFVSINHAPTITSATSSTVAENASLAAIVYTATATDPDANTVITYSISGGADAALFNINASTGAVTFKASPNFEAPADAGGNNVYDIVVQASDGSLSTTQAVAIAVSNVNEAPTVTSSATATIAENVSTSTVVYLVTGTDPDPNTTLTYSISGGADAALFNLDTKTGEVTFKTSPNFEAPTDAGANNVYDILVQASDGSPSAMQAVAVTVTNLNEVPSVTSSGTATTMEGISTTMVVYTVDGTDPDANTTLTYSISGGADAALFNINTTTGAVTFQTSPNFTSSADAGANNVYDIVVQTSDGLLFANKEVAISVSKISQGSLLGKDFNTDGQSDILLQNVKDGSCYIWDLNNKTLVDSGFVGWAPGADWQAKGTGDFNGDGRSDILLQNVKDGSCYIWNLNNKTLVDSGFVGWAPGPDWQAKGTGDFNGDGKSDILLQNLLDGSCYIWNLNNTTVVDHGFVGWAPGSDWQASGTGDFNGDGKSDILLQNLKDGSCYIWNLNNKTLVDSGFVGWAPGPDWQAKGTGDFNGDGESDILLQNVQDGACYIWNLTNTTLVDHGFVGWVPGSDWLAAI